MISSILLILIVFARHLSGEIILTRHCGDCFASLAMTDREIATISLHINIDNTLSQKRTGIVKEVCQDIVTDLSENGFRMELNSFHYIIVVSNTHYYSFRGLSGDY